MHAAKPTLVELCQERGLDHVKGRNGKAATMEILRARLYLAEAGAEPDDTLVLEMSKIIHNTSKARLIAALTKLDPATDANNDTKAHGLALLIARAIVNREKRLNAEGTQPGMDGLDHFMKDANPLSADQGVAFLPTDHVMKDASSPSADQGAASLPTDHVMKDANSLSADQGAASSPTDHNQPKPLPNPIASRMTEIKQAKIRQANRPEAGLQIPPLGASNPSVTAASAFGSTFSHPYSDPFSRLANPQQGRSAGVQGTFLAADGDAGPSFIGTGGQAGGREQAALRLGHSILDIIGKDDAIVRFLTELLASTIREQASHEVTREHNELIKERENNRLMLDRIEELEAENNTLQLRVEELNERERVDSERRRGFMTLFRRMMVESQEAARVQDTRLFQVIQHIDQLEQAERA